MLHSALRRVPVYVELGRLLTLVAGAADESLRAARRAVAAVGIAGYGRASTAELRAARAVLAPVARCTVDAKS